MLKVKYENINCLFVDTLKVNEKVLNDDQVINVEHDRHYLVLSIWL